MKSTGRGISNDQSKNNSRRHLNFHMAHLHLKHWEFLSLLYKHVYILNYFPLERTFPKCLGGDQILTGGLVFFHRVWGRCGFLVWEATVDSNSRTRQKWESKLKTIPICTVFERWQKRIHMVQRCQKTWILKLCRAAFLKIVIFWYLKIRFYYLF